MKNNMFLQIVSWSAAVIAVLMIIFTILPIWPTNIWWIRDMGFPRVQVLIMLLLTAIPLALWFRDHDLKFSIAIVAFFCALYQVYEIFPYTAIAPVESEEAEMNDSTRQVSFMVANVLMKNRNAPELFRIIEEYDPDIFVGVETDRWWTTEISAELKERYPHMVMEPIDNTYGIIVCSRYELVNPQVRYLVIDTIPSVITDVRLPNGDEFRLYAVHPLPPLPGMDTEERDAELLMVAKMVKKDSTTPSIVLGDLNDVAWSRTTKRFQEISGMLDPRRGRGMYNTFSAEYFFLRYPLDHIFHTKQFRLISLDRLDAWGSDHFPMAGTFSYEPEKQHEQDAPESDPEKEQEAEEDIQKGLEKSRNGGE